MFASRPGPSRVGQRLGTLVLTRMIGEGGMGAVYEAREEPGLLRRAVKILHPELARSQSMCRRFWREAQIAASLSGDAFVPVTGFDFAGDGTPYLVMELLEGQDLGAIFAAEERLATGRLIDLIGQACRGLRLAHEHSPPIVHRDLKPENLFVCRSEDGYELVKILDFGIAKLLESSPAGSATRTGSALGTPHYMSPEQAAGARAIDARTDVYALGVILYEGLSGKKPHPGESYNQILSHVLTQEPIPLTRYRPDLPPALVALVQRATHHDPARRVSSVVELAESLARFATDLPRAPQELTLRSASPRAHDTRATTVERADTVREQGRGSVLASRDRDASRRSSRGGSSRRRKPRTALKYGVVGVLLGCLTGLLPRALSGTPVPAATLAASVRAVPRPLATEAVEQRPRVEAERRPSFEAAREPSRKASATPPLARSQRAPSLQAARLDSPPGSDLTPPSAPPEIETLLPP